MSINGGLLDTFSETVAGSEVTPPQETVYVNESTPAKPASGV